MLTWDVASVQDLQSLRHDLQRLDGIAIPDNGVCQMKLKLFEYVDTGDVPYCLISIATHGYNGTTLQRYGASLTLLRALKKN